jgi:hypothetical protein
MLMLLKAVFDTDAANEVIGSGQGAEVNRRMVERLQPEAFYAFAEDGQRTVIMVFEMADPSQIPVLTERFYQQGNAKVTLTPCMNLEDLQKGFEERPVRWLLQRARQFQTSSCTTSRAALPKVVQVG